MNNYFIKNNNNKGFTIVELVIVLALLGIISMMFVTFSTLSAEHTVSITHENEVSDDVSSIKELFTDWVSMFDSDEYIFYIVSTKDIIYHENTEEDLEVETDVLYAFKKSVADPTGLNYYSFVTSGTYETYRLYLNINGNIIGTNPNGDDLIYDGSLYVDNLKFTIDKNANNQNALLVKLELNYQYKNYLTNKQVVTSIDFYKATKCEVYYGGKHDVEK